MTRLKFEDLPDDLKKKTASEFGIKIRMKPVEGYVKVVSWNDVPDDWNKCVEHGLAWFGDFPCFWCGRE